MKTYSAKPAEIENRWYVVDAEDVVLGRLAAEIAKIIRGKHKTTFTPHMNCGDHVIVVNAAKVKLTGNKLRDRRFYWHTGHPGGIKDRTIGQILAGSHPDRVITKAVERMVPRGPLGREQMRLLRVYPGAEHPHDAQKPEALDIAGRNPKNKRSF
ncbi:MAG: 50S ribosomal protein L13 [Alphaproteobacteria bacterium]